jgi:3-hexulose-6-phosphate synthase
LKLQLALDRVSIESAIELAGKSALYVEWIEVGTSLIKEFGMESVRKLRRAFPDHTLLADMKISDNARYECQLAFQAGADVITVMGAAPTPTLLMVQEEAKKAGKQVIIDLLNTSEEDQKKLRTMFPKTIFCLHTSKDEQEERGSQLRTTMLKWNGYRLAIAGGVTLATLPKLAKIYQPELFIVGGAITGEENVEQAAQAFQQAIRFQKMVKEQVK